MAGRCCHGREALGTYGTPSHNSACYSEAPQPTLADLPPPPKLPPAAGVSAARRHRRRVRANRHLLRAPRRLAHSLALLVLPASLRTSMRAYHLKS